MSYQLLKGDCLERMKEIPTGSVDLIICDLPYGLSKCKWDKPIPLDRLWQEYRRVLKPYGIVLLFGVQPFISDVVNSNRKEFSFSWYWAKNHKTGILNAKKQPLRRIEEVAAFVVNRKKKDGHEKATYNPQGLKKLDKPKVKKRGQHEQVYGARAPQCLQTYGNYPVNLLFFNAAEKRLHPTQKPVDLLAYLIKTHSNEGQTILDNCMGSGSTGVACIQTNRNFIGIELDENYFQIAKERLKKAESEMKI